MARTVKISPKIKSEIIGLAAEGISLSDIAAQYDLRTGEIESIVGRKIEVVTRAPTVGNIELKVETSLVRRQLSTMPGFVDLVDGATIAGVKIEAYVQSALIRMLEKIAGGMSPVIAAQRSGLSADILAGIIRQAPLLKDMIMQAQHVTDMRSMNAVAGQIERGDGEMALEILQRQTGDFRPAPKEIVISGADAYKMAWGAIDAEFDEIRKLPHGEAGPDQGGNSG